MLTERYIDQVFAIDPEHGVFYHHALLKESTEQIQALTTQLQKERKACEELSKHHDDVLGECKKQRRRADCLQAELDWDDSNKKQYD